MESKEIPLHSQLESLESRVARLEDVILPSTGGGGGGGGIGERLATLEQRLERLQEETDQHGKDVRKLETRTKEIVEILAELRSLVEALKEGHIPPPEKAQAMAR